jgi:hypothetical protein
VANAATEQQAFDRTMKKILSVSKQELQRRLDAEKSAKASSSHVPAVSR